MNRREFLRIASLRALGAGAALTGLPTIVSARALGRDGHVAPSNRIVMAGVGLGWMGGSNINSFLNKPEVQFVAVCDVDPGPRKDKKNQIDKHYGNSDCATYVDMFEMFDRGDLDAVMLALPDHWHGVAGCEAMRRGLDVYGEKPLTLSLQEGRAIVETSKQYGRIWQTGSWQRSTENFRRAAELVRNGRIGKVKRVVVGLGGGHADWNGTKDRTSAEPPPEGFDYERWLGPAQWSPYTPAKLHKTWRWHLDYGGGMLTDWVCHHLDVAHWGLGLDRTGPVEISCTGTFGSGYWNAPTDYSSICKYENGVEINISNKNDMGVMWHGDKGTVWVTRGDIDANPKSVLKEVIGPNEIHLYKSNDHWQNFLDCIRSREETISCAEIAHRSTSVAHLSLISMRVGRKLRWDPVAERFLNDPEAERLLMARMRSPYHL